MFAVLVAMFGKAVATVMMGFLLAIGFALGNAVYLKLTGTAAVPA